MIHFSEYEYWCPLRDLNVVRVSVVDRNGREFFMVVPADGRGYRDRREKAIDACVEAIELGCDPGEVRVS